MFKVRTHNQIALEGLERFPRDRFEVGTELADPEGILLRSHVLTIMNWLSNRAKERTTWHGFVLVASGIAMWLAPTNLIPIAMFAYVSSTLWNSEQ